MSGALTPVNDFLGPRWYSKGMNRLAALALALIPLSASAQYTTLPYPSVTPTATKAFRVLPASGRRADGVTLTGSYGGRVPDNFTKKGSYGASGGVEAELPLNDAGTHLVGGVTFFDHYRVYEQDGVWKQDRTRAFPLNVGVVQRIAKVGWGDALGERGVFLEPQVGAGLGSAGITTFAGPTADPEPWSNGVIESRTLALPTPYITAGVRAQLPRGMAVGLEARHYRVLGTGDKTWGGTYANLTLSATPSRLKKAKKPVPAIEQ